MLVELRVRYGGDCKPWFVNPRYVVSVSVAKPHTAWVIVSDPGEGGITNEVYGAAVEVAAKLNTTEATDAH